MNDMLWRDTVFHIVCVAGQSNAAGFDESPVNFRPEDAPARIFQLGYWGEDNLKPRPLLPCAQNFQDMRPFGHPDSTVPGAKGIHLPLARLLLPLIPPGDALLILPCAYGGTGFTVNEIGPYDDQALRPAPGAWRWGVSSNYYRALRDRIAWVLDEAGTLAERMNAGHAQILPVAREEAGELRRLLEMHAQATGSGKAAAILRDFDAWLPRFRTIVSAEYLTYLKSRSVS